MFEADVDAIYEEKFMLSDLDDMPWGDDDEPLTPYNDDDDIYGSDICVVCEKWFSLNEMKRCPDYSDDWLCLEHYDEYVRVTKNG